MNRDIAKAIQTGESIVEKRKQLDLSAANINYFLKKFDEDAGKMDITNAAFYLINNAYLAGLAVGNRNK